MRILKRDRMTSFFPGSNQTLTLFSASVDYLGLGSDLDSFEKIEVVGYGGYNEINALDSLDIKIDNWDIKNSQVFFEDGTIKSGQRN